MIKLLNILKEINEGARATSFNIVGNTKIADDVEISYSPLKGEELKTISHYIEKKSKYKIFYGLAPDPSSSEENLRAVQNYLKNKINLDKLVDFVTKDIKNKKELKDIKYVGYLESRGSLSKKLAIIISNIYNAEIIPINKINYPSFESHVNWEQYHKENKTTKKLIDKYIISKNKNYTNPSHPDFQKPRTIKKSGNTQSSIIQRLFTKYNIDPAKSVDKNTPEIYKAIIDCYNNNKKLIIVDDNIDTGTDFKNLFIGIDDIIYGLNNKIKKLGILEEELQNINNQLEQIKNNKYYNNSSYKGSKLEKNYNDLIQLRLNIYQHMLSIKPHLNNNIFGYVLYKFN